MRLSSLYLVAGTAVATVSAMKESDTSTMATATTTITTSLGDAPPSTKTRELDISSTTSTTTTTMVDTATDTRPIGPRAGSFDGVASAIKGGIMPAKAAKNAARPAPVVPAPSSKGDYREVFPESDQDQVENTINGKGKKEPVLPGSCEDYVNELIQACNSAAEYYEQVEQEKAAAKMEKVGVSVRPEVDRVIEDQLWILRSYIYCCAIQNDGRGSDHYETRRDLEDHVHAIEPRGAAAAANAATTPSTPTPSTHALPLLPDGGLSRLDKSPVMHEWEHEYDAGAACANRQLYLIKWYENYYAWTAEATKYLAEEVPKLGQDRDVKASHDDLNRELVRRDRIVRGYKRCCRDQPHPGPAPTGTNQFPSIAKAAKFGNY